MKSYFLIVLSLLTVCPLFAQPQPLWAEVEITDALKGRNEVPFTQPQLRWSDFQGKPDKKSDWTAMTYSGIKLKYESKYYDHRQHILIKLYPYMDQSRSWYKDNGHNNYTLAHEQIHFNITILVATQLAEVFRNTDFTKDNFSKKINRLHDEYIQKLEDLQAQYDDETAHGTRQLPQRMWERKVQQQLSAFD